MKRQHTILMTAALAAVLLGCPPKENSGTTGTSGTGSTAASSGNEILVGEFGSLTGAQATFGTSTHNGIMMAIDEVNAAGGINGKQIVVKTEDDQSKQDEAANAVQKLVSQNGVIAMLGEVASSASLAAAPICQNAKVPMITPSSTNDEVTKKGDYIFRVCFTDSYQGSSLGSYVAKQLGFKNVALLTDVKSDYSQGLGASFEKEFTANGGKIVARASYTNGDADFKSQLTTVKAANPQALFVPGYYTDIGQMAIQKKDLGLNVPMIGGDGWESPRLIEIGGPSLEGSMYSNHYFYGDPTPLVHGFVEKYKQRFKETPDALAALGYDAARVLADALKRTGGKGGAELRDSIAATKNFPGVTGAITIGPTRDAIGKKLVIEEIKGGQLTLKATVEPSGTPAPATATTATH